MSTAKFYSDRFKQANQKSHQTHNQYGSVTGYVFYFNGRDLPLMGHSVLSVIRDFRPESVLDYGCGKGLGADNLVYNYPDLSVTKYDPFVEEFSQEPTGCFDLVICYNVLQIVEAEYLEAVLEHLDSLTKRNLLLNILVNKKSTRDLDWWLDRLGRFNIIMSGSSIPKPSHDMQGETFDSVSASFWITK